METGRLRVFFGRVRSFVHVVTNGYNGSLFFAPKLREPQLMVYALALSRRTGLRLYDFVCAWFDEHHYFEFYPLHVVHKRRGR
jgi:hypothetical protein